MSIRSKATRLGAMAGAAALMGGLALSAVANVGAQVGTATPASNVGGPRNVPSARVYGTITGPVGSGAVTASIGGVACGFGTVSGNSYFVDVQAIAGCTAPGAVVTLTVGGNPAMASPAAVLPPVPTSVLANLTVSVAAPVSTATMTPPPPPPPPARASASPTATAAPPTMAPTARVTATTAPPTMAPTARATTAPTTAPTARATTAPTARATSAATVTTQKPNAPVAQKANAPVAQKAVGVAAAAVAQQAAAAPVAQRSGAVAAAPVAQGPGAVAAAPAARVALPNTGTGGLLDQRDSGTTSVALLSILLGAVLLSATGLVSYRRSR